MAESGPAEPILGDVRPFRRVIVEDLNFEGVGDPIIDIAGVNDHAAVGAVGRFEFEIQDKVLVIPVRPNGLVLGGGHDPVLGRPDAFGEHGVGQVRFEEFLPGRGIRVAQGRERRLSNGNRRQTGKNHQSQQVLSYHAVHSLAVPTSVSKPHHGK